MGFRPKERGVVLVVLAGSKPRDEGVRRAFRFWDIVSSIAALESRRKSGHGRVWSDWVLRRKLRFAPIGLADWDG